MKAITDEFFPCRLLLPLNSHGTSPDRHLAGQRTQQNRESSNGPLRAGGKPVPTLGSSPRVGFFRSCFLFEHDLFRKPVPTFRDHALGSEFQFLARPERDFLARLDLDRLAGWGALSPSRAAAPA